MNSIIKNKKKVKIKGEYNELVNTSTTTEQRHENKNIPNKVWNAKKHSAMHSDDITDREKQWSMQIVTRLSFIYKEGRKKTFNSMHHKG